MKIKNFMLLSTVLAASLVGYSTIANHEYNSIFDKLDRTILKTTKPVIYMLEDTKDDTFHFFKGLARSGADTLGIEVQSQVAFEASHQSHQLGKSVQRELNDLWLTSDLPSLSQVNLEVGKFSKDLKSLSGNFSKDSKIYQAILENGSKFDKEVKIHVKELENFFAEHDKLPELLNGKNSAQDFLSQLKISNVDVIKVQEEFSKDFAQFVKTVLNKDIVVKIVDKASEADFSLSIEEGTLAKGANLIDQGVDSLSNGIKSLTKKFQ